MRMPRLFDHVELSADPYLYTESSFTALQRAAGREWQRVRDLLEDWYSAYPDPDLDLYNRFRQDSPRQHDAAWWELYVYTLFRKLGYEIEIHPPLPESTRRPDMLVTRGNDTAYVECAVAFDGPNSAHADSEAWLKDCINAVDSPDFGFSLRINSPGSRRAPQAEVKRQIGAWVSNLDYDDDRAAIDAHAGPRSTKTFEFADWRVTLTAIPRSPNVRGTGGPNIYFGPAVSIFGDTSVQRLRKLLRKKASQCRNAQSPVVVAVLSRMLYAQANIVDQALFGSEIVRYALSDDGTSAQFAEFVRDTNGLWHPSAPGRLSGVLFAETLNPALAARSLPSLWVNPWAAQSMPESLPFETRTATDKGLALVPTPAAVEPHLILDLPADWPGN